MAITSTLCVIVDCIAYVQHDIMQKDDISVFGYIIYFCGIPIALRIKGMRSVVLSTTEAEYMALSEDVKELKFIVQLLQTMNI